MSGPYISIEISRAGGPFEAAAFEDLKVGDRFRVTDPPDRADGTIFTAKTDATPNGPDDVGNWSVSVDQIERPA